MIQPQDVTSLGDSLHAQASRVLPHNADTVWPWFAAFGDIAAWHPLIASSVLETADPAPRVGSVRLLHTTGQDVIREELITYDSDQRILAYSFLTSPFAVTGYLATVHVTDIQDPAPDASGNACQITWGATFVPDATADGPDLRDMFASQVFAVGLDALGAHIADS